MAARIKRIAVLGVTSLGTWAIYGTGVDVETKELADIASSNRPAQVVAMPDSADSQRGPSGVRAPRRKLGA
jgi:hypothetical protein